MCNDLPDLIRQLEAAGRKSGLTPDDLCVAAKVNRATWQRLKASKSDPRMSTVCRLRTLAAKLVEG